MPAALLACDWGGTNLRAWTLDEAGGIEAQRDLPLGVAGLAPGETARRFEEEVRPALAAQGLPAILCGMVGSNLGWSLAPYVDCPADLAACAASLHAVSSGESPVWIAPGLRCAGLGGVPDVMRGEETQVLGWLEQEPQRKRGRHVICHPGTHAKWVLVEDGRIVRFVTVMTGELFAILRRHSLLRSDAEAGDEAAFDEGCAAAGDGGMLAARLFTARSRVVGQGKPADTTPSYLSGLLIGAELAGARGLLNVEADGAVVLLGDAALCAWYARALRGRGTPVETFDGEAAAIAGLFAIYRMGIRS